MYYEGPLPPPELLIKYNEAHPEAADIILRSFEKEGAHRRRMEAALVGKGIVRSFRGQVFGFIVAMVALLGGVGLLMLDKDIQGYSTIGAGFVALVGAFTVGRIAQVRGLREQAEDFSRNPRAD